MITELDKTNFFSEVSLRDPFKQVLLVSFYTGNLLILLDIRVSIALELRTLQLVVSGGSDYFNF